LNEILTVIIKASNRSQCLLDWFITHALITIRFKQEIIAFATTQTSALGIHYSDVMSCACHNKEVWFFEFKTFFKHNDFVYKLCFDNVLISVLSLRSGNPFST
jgi:hypothetical protein